MKVKRGDVVLVDYPFSAGGGSKRRPAVVVQADRNNQRLSNTIVATITTNIARAHYEPAQLLIDLDTPEGRQSGLKSRSAVSCENLLTVDEGLVIRWLGRLPPETMRRVDECLKVSLGLTSPL